MFKKVLISAVLCMFASSVYAGSDPILSAGCSIDITQYKNNATVIKYQNSNHELCFDEETGNSFEQCCKGQKMQLKSYDMLCSEANKPVKKFVKKMSRKKSPIHKSFKKVVKNNKSGVVDEIMAYIFVENSYDDFGSLYERLLEEQDQIMELCIENVRIIKKRVRVIEGC